MSRQACLASLEGHPRLPPPPPHEAENTNPRTRAKGASHLMPSFSRSNTNHKAGRTVRPSSVNQMAESSMIGKLVTRGIVSVGAVVVTFTVTRAGLATVRANELGETEHVASEGAPEQARETD